MAEISSTDALAGLDPETRRSVADALWQRELDVSAIEPSVLAALTSQAHSPEAFGSRMRTFLEYLLEHPVEHTPSYDKYYERLLPYCDRLSPQASYAMALNFLGPAATVGYDQVPNRANFQFPRDWDTKPRSAVGWHFFVGSAWDEDGVEYGVELMFFQGALFPPALAAGLGLTADENQVVEQQFAISVAGGDHWQAEPVALSGLSGLVSHSERPFTYRLGRNSIECHDADEFFPVTIKAWGVDRGSSPERDLAVDITFTSGKQYLLQGAGGCMPSVDGMGSLYYSIPNVQLDPATSTLTIDGRTVRLVRGTFWFDRQWGYISGAARSNVMNAATYSKDPAPTGWDWFMAQLDGDRQVTIFATHSLAMREFYEQSGPTPPGPMVVRVGGTYMDPDLATSMTWGTLTVSDWIRATSSPNPDRYIVTNAWYPNRWEFTFDDVMPEDIRSFTMTPIVDKAQVGFFANGQQYAEGAVVITDPSGSDIGRGFAESVAFGDTRQTVHRLAGLPETQAHIDSLSHRTTPSALKILNTAYVLAHQKELAEVIKNSVGLEFFTDPEASSTS
jgi:predicted secreted hydrolase